MNQLKTIFLLGVLSAVLIAIGGSLGSGYLYIFTAMALIMNVGAYYFSDRLVLRMNNAREASVQEAPALHRMVEDLSRTAGIPKPKVYIVEDEQPNAFATGRNPEHGVVAVTTGILRILNERQLRGVIAHELAHIKNRDILVATIAASIAMAVSGVAQAAQFAALFGGGRRDEEGGGNGGLIGSIVMMIVAPLAATLIQLSISRSREYLADETGAHIAGDPESLATALESLHHSAGMIPSHASPATASLFIVNPFAGQGRLKSLFSTHPAVEERTRRLRALSVAIQNPTIRR